MSLFKDESQTRWDTAEDKNKKYIMWGGIAVAAYFVLKFLKVIR